MRAIIALFLALAIGAAPVGFPIGAASGAPAEIAAADCAAACHCDKASPACADATGCAWQCGFNASAVVPPSDPAVRFDHAAHPAIALADPSGLFLRPPLPPPQG